MASEQEQAEGPQWAPLPEPYQFVGRREHDGYTDDLYLLVQGGDRYAVEVIDDTGWAALVRDIDQASNHEHQSVKAVVTLARAKGLLPLTPLEQAQERVAVLEAENAVLREAMDESRKKFSRIQSLTAGNDGWSDGEIREATDDAIYEIDAALNGGGNDGQ